MRTFHNLEEVAKHVGEHLGHSAWRKISQTDLDQFAKLTSDDQWLHVDPIRAASGPFGSTVAHGFLTLSLAPALIRDIYELSGFSARINYGLDKVRFVAPVPVNSQIRLGATFTKLDPDERGARLTTRASFEVDTEGATACVADMVTLLVL
jgi:acyl dehydratase